MATEKIIMNHKYISIRWEPEVEALEELILNEGIQDYKIAFMFQEPPIDKDDILTYIIIFEKHG